MNGSGVSRLRRSRRQKARRQKGTKPATKVKSLTK